MLNAFRSIDQWSDQNLLAPWVRFLGRCKEHKGLRSSLAGPLGLGARAWVRVRIMCKMPVGVVPDNWRREPPLPPGCLMADSIEQQVIDIITRKKQLEPGRVTVESSFADLGIDSLDGIDLLFEFEDAFAISIPDEVAQQMKTVRQATDALREALAGRDQGAS